MIPNTIRLMILALALIGATPAKSHAQLNPALIGEGAQLWGNHCGRCHNTRPPTERSDLEWAIIVKHMRARANLTRHQADAVLAYLQATNTAEQGTSGAHERWSVTTKAPRRDQGPATLRRTHQTPYAGRNAQPDREPTLTPNVFWIIPIAEESSPKAEATLF